MSITHSFASVKDDPTDATKVGKTKWNAAHVIGAGTIVNADINASAEIAVSKLGDGTPYQTLRTDSSGAIVEWGYKLYVGTSAPANPVANDIWIDTAP